jgi:hypothetical protein
MRPPTQRYLRDSPGEIHGLARVAQDHGDADTATWARLPPAGMPAPVIRMVWCPNLIEGQGRVLVLAQVEEPRAPGCSCR